jgi:hypothetical protein
VYQQLVSFLIAQKNPTDLRPLHVAFFILQKESWGQHLPYRAPLAGALEQKKIPLFQ